MIDNPDKNKDGNKYRVLIVDDHPLVRSGLSAIIQSEPDLQVCCEAESVSEALQVIDRLTPDVAIIDLSLKEGDGLDLIKRLKQRNPGLKMLVCSVYDETLFARRAITAGALGYISKKEATHRIIEAIRKVLRGEYFVSDKIVQQTLSDLAIQSDPSRDLLAALSDRELQVYRMIGSGIGNAQISQELHISVKTVEHHKETIKKKLNLGTAKDLTRHAMQWQMNEV